MAAAERKRRAARRAAPTNGTVSTQDLEPLLDALKANKAGVQGVRLSTRKAGIVGELGRAFNELAETREKTNKELVRVSNVVGREGRLTTRAKVQGVTGFWADLNGALSR